MSISLSVEEWFDWAWNESPPTGAIEVMVRIGVVDSPWDRRWAFLGNTVIPAYKIEIGCTCVSAKKNKNRSATILESTPLPHRAFRLASSSGDVNTAIALAECPKCKVIYWAGCPCL